MYIAPSLLRGAALSGAPHAWWRGAIQSCLPTARWHHLCHCAGVRHAAVRKLQHELGIPASELPLDAFRFLTRLHYCAADR